MEKLEEITMSLTKQLSFLIFSVLIGFCALVGVSFLCLDSELSKAQNPRLIIERMAGKSCPP
jgi:hypothetical protein